MNERIKELYKQADINIDSFQFSGTPIKYIVSESSLEKFAELLVRECIEQFAFSVTDNTEIIQDRFTQCRKVAKHFGVES